MGVTLWVEENETQSVWNMLSAMVVLDVPVKVKPALVIDADEETAQLVRKCLEASGLRLLVDQDLLLADQDLISQHEALSRLAEIEAASQQVQIDAMDQIPWVDQPAVAGVERSEDINGVVTYQPVDFEKKPVGEPVIVVLEKESAHVCEVCGGALYGRRKSAKVCSSEECQAEAQRRYARAYYQKNNSKKAKKAISHQPSAISHNSEKKGGAMMQEEEKLSVSTETAERAKQMVAHAFPWRFLDGERSGKTVTARLMASLLERKKVKPGVRVAHAENGLFVVAKRQNGSGAECVYELEPCHE